MLSHYEIDLSIFFHWRCQYLGELGCESACIWRRLPPAIFPPSPPSVLLVLAGRVLECPLSWATDGRLMQMPPLEKMAGGKSNRLQNSFLLEALRFKTNLSCCYKETYQNWFSFMAAQQKHILFCFPSIANAVGRVCTGTSIMPCTILIKITSGSL